MLLARIELPLEGQRGDQDRRLGRLSCVLKRSGRSLETQAVAGSRMGEPRCGIRGQSIGSRKGELFTYPIIELICSPIS
jgi:hypothetical protein